MRGEAGVETGAEKGEDLRFRYYYPQGRGEDMIGRTYRREEGE